MKYIGNKANKTSQISPPPATCPTLHTCARFNRKKKETFQKFPNSTVIPWSFLFFRCFSKSVQNQEEDSWMHGWRPGCTSYPAPHCQLSRQHLLFCSLLGHFRNSTGSPGSPSTSTSTSTRITKQTAASDASRRSLAAGGGRLCWSTVVVLVPGSSTTWFSLGGRQAPQHPSQVDPWIISWSFYLNKKYQIILLGRS